MRHVSSLLILLSVAFILSHSGTSADDGKRAVGEFTVDQSIQEKCLSVLRKGMHGDEFWPAIHAAEGLTLAGIGNEVREFLTPKLKLENDDQQRCGIARELVRAGDRRRAAIMLEILAGKDPHGHVHAAESLYKVHEIGDGNAMRKALSQSENGRLKLMAAAALGRWGNAEALSVIRDHLTHDDPELRRTAAWILGRTGDKSDITRLRKSLTLAEDAFSRCYVEHSLAALGDKVGLAALGGNLKSDDAAIRTYAATFAGDARAVSVADRLIELLDDENIDVRVRSAQSLMVLSRPAPHNDQEDVSTVVFAADKDHPRNTEGSVVELNDGSLLFAVTRFVDGQSDFSNAAIVARRSQDGGRTWGEPRVLQESTGKMNVMSATLRRLRAPRADTIALFYLEKNGYDDLRVLTRFSEDEGETFGEPKRVSTEPGYHVMNNDRVVQLAGGRLLAPVASTADVRKVNHFVSFCWLSDDGGATWRKGKGEVDLPKRGAMEPEVIELNDGRVLMICRTQLGYIATSISGDGGDTWGKPDRLPLKAPEAPATLRRIPSTGDLLLIWNNTYSPDAGHGGRRTPLTAAVSSDECKTWSHIRNLETANNRTFAYTSLIFTRGRAHLTYWDRTPTGISTRFRSLPIEWFYAK